MGQTQDWFAQNAPKPAGDWFAQNAPSAPKPPASMGIDSNAQARQTVLKPLNDAAKQPSYWQGVGQRLKEVVNPPPLPEAPTVYGIKDFANKFNEAQAVASFGVGMGESPMGMPETPPITQTGRTVLRDVGQAAFDTAGAVKDAVVDTTGAAKDAIGSTLREPGRFKPNSAPGAPASKGPLKPLVRAIVDPLGGPDRSGILSGRNIAEAVIPAHPEPIDPRMSLGERLNTLKPWSAPEPESRLGSPDNPGWVAKLPDRMPKPDMPPANAPKIFTPSDAGPKFTGSEGRAATWTNERVMELAKQGNREAIQQAVRRGFELPPNARYVAGDPSYGTGIYNPRDVTTFTPDGTPIRMQGGPRKPAPTGATIEMPPARTPRIDPVDFSHPSAQQVIAEHAPQLREIATRLQGAEPDIAQHLIDIADGKSVGLEQLQGKIRDPQAAQDYSRLLDNARREARTARTSQVDNQSRGAGSQAERATQAPELKSTTRATLSDVRKSISSKVYTQQEMIDAGADGYLDRATKQEIPLSKITGREPTPAMEGGYQKGRKVTQPIEVEKQGDEYILYSGNHRVTQAELNGQTTIQAFVKEEPRAAKSTLKNLKSKP